MASEAVPAASDHISSSAGKLNHALTGYASAFVKKELQQLAAAYDDTLARSHVPKLRALLKEVDNERAAFEHEKDKLLQHLRTKLQRLDVEGPAIDAGLAELQSIAPRYLSVIPGTSALTIRPPTPIMSPPRENSYFTTVLGANLGPGEPTTGAQTSPVQAARLHESSTRPRSTPAVGRTLITPKPTQTSQIDDQVQEQVIAESTIAVQSQSTKRSRAESADEIKVSVAKRQRTDNDKSSTNVARRDIEQIAFPNLETGESIFRHAQRKGYFVIRCSLPDCAKPTFSEPPLAYNRALRHFENHSELIPDGEELTNEYIFEKFGWEITGSNLASKYWIKEHLGKVPHTFTPGKSRPRASRTDALSLPIKEQEDTDFVLSSNPRDSISAVDSEAEDSEQEMPRRTRRKVPRPDYAELVANRDLWNASDGESVTSKTAKGSRASSKSKTNRPQKPKNQILVNTPKPSTSKPSTPKPSTPKPSTPKPSAPKEAEPKPMSIASKPATPSAWVHKSEIRWPSIMADTGPLKPFGYNTEQWPRRSAPSE